MYSKFLPLLGSEVALSLYPQLIKLIPTTIEIQVAVRCITYSILAIIGYYTSNNTILSTIINKTSKRNILSSLSSLLSLSSYIVMGLVNIIHIISSYMCFNILSSGVGYSIFYIYPIFNLLGRSLFYNEKIDILNYIYIIIAIIGVYLIYKNKTNTALEPIQYENENENNLFDNLNIKNTNIGIAAGIVSALTESIIYFMVKNDIVSASPFIQLLKTYLLGGILSIIYLIQKINYINLDYHYWITIILFNSLIGFLGYLLRFITIPRLSTLVFNSLIFIGVIFSYLWGYVLSNEPITYSNLSGTALILMSILLINNK
jgi:drug/metabolite transporter (DMT)-like permease